MNLEERIKRTKVKRSNCRGTALYLCGLTSFDNYRNFREFERAIRELQETTTPERGDLVVLRWTRYNIPAHAGVISQIDEQKIKILERPGANKALRETEIDELRKTYPRGYFKFYRVE